MVFRADLPKRGLVSTVRTRPRRTPRLQRVPGRRIALFNNTSSTLASIPIAVVPRSVPPSCPFPGGVFLAPLLALSASQSSSRDSVDRSCCTVGPDLVSAAQLRASPAWMSVRRYLSIRPESRIGQIAFAEHKLQQPQWQETTRFLDLR